jgi:hypothetical protein
MNSSTCWKVIADSPPTFVKVTFALINFIDIENSAILSLNERTYNQILGGNPADIWYPEKCLLKWVLLIQYFCRGYDVNLIKWSIKS